MKPKVLAKLGVIFANPKIIIFLGIEGIKLKALAKLKVTLAGLRVIV